VFSHPFARKRRNCNGRIQVNKSLLSVVLLDQFPGHNAQKPLLPVLDTILKPVRPIVEAILKPVIPIIVHTILKPVIPIVGAIRRKLSNDESRA
jgi:hypothetical protein